MGTIDASLQQTAVPADWDSTDLGTTQVFLLYRQPSPGRKTLHLLTELGVAPAHMVLNPARPVDAVTLDGFDLILFEAGSAPLTEIQATLTWVRMSSRAPLVVLTKLTQADHALLALAAGADAVFTPAMKPELLVAHCRALLRRWRSVRWRRPIVAAVTAPH